MSAIQAAKIKMPNEPKIIPKRAHFLFFTFRTLYKPIIIAPNENREPIKTAKVPILDIPRTIINPKPTMPSIPEVLAIFWWLENFSTPKESFATT